jgi:hypothetical protein
MQCHEMQELLSAHLDGMLDPSVKIMVERHLEHCPACREEYENLKMVAGMVSNLPLVEPPPEFRRDLRLRLEQIGRPGVKANFLQRLTVGKWSAVMAVAASFVLVIGIAALWYGMPDRYGSPGHGVRAGSLAQRDQAGSYKVGDAASAVKAPTQSEDSGALRERTPESGPPEFLKREQAPDEAGKEQLLQEVRQEEIPEEVRREQAPEGKGGLLWAAGSPPAENGGMPGIAGRGNAAAPLSPQPGQPAQVILGLKVDDKDKAVRQISGIAQKYGGIATVLPENEGRELLVRIPKIQLEKAIEEIGGTGQFLDSMNTVNSEIYSSDETEQQPGSLNAGTETVDIRIRLE